MSDPDRARDHLGRPLSVDAENAFPPVDIPENAGDRECWNLMLTYLDQGLPFHAHEVCETRWRASVGEMRQTWKALAQWCAALTHEARGNESGAKSVAKRARANLAACEVTPDWLDRAHVDEDCARLESL